MKTLQLRVTAYLITVHTRIPESTEGLTHEEGCKMQEAILQPGEPEVTSPAAQMSRSTLLPFHSSTASPSSIPAQMSGIKSLSLPYFLNCNERQSPNFLFLCFLSFKHCTQPCTCLWYQGSHKLPLWPTNMVQEDHPHQWQHGTFSLCM